MQDLELGIGERTWGRDHLSGFLRPENVESTDGEGAPDEGPVGVDEAEHPAHGYVLPDAVTVEQFAHLLNLPVDAADEFGAVLSLSLIHI